MRMMKFKSVEDYIAFQPKEIRMVLEKIRKTIKKAAPRAEESISYGMPVYKLNGVLVYFGTFKHHIGFFPGPSAIKKFAKDLSDYKQSKGTVQFQYGEDVPYDMITKIVEYKVMQNMMS